MSKVKVLIAEDDPDLLEVLRLTFDREGWNTVAAVNGTEALAAARRHAPDVAVLDVMMPEKDGLEVCRELRGDSATRHLPIIMLTAKSEESDVVLGLGLGADDYLAKPARPAELVARVKALLRRRASGETSQTDSLISHGDLVIDPARFEIRVGEQVVVLTPTEFKILQCLVSRPGRVFRRQEIMNLAFGGAAVIEARNVDTHVKTIRKKMGAAGDCVQTVRGIGYRFEDR